MDKLSLMDEGRGLVCVCPPSPPGAVSDEGSAGRGNSTGEDTEVEKKRACVGEIRVQHACKKSGQKETGTVVGGA